MPQPAHSTEIARLTVSLHHYANAWLGCDMIERIYGQDDTESHYVCDGAVPEELAAFYDDTTHAVRLATKDFLEALTDIGAPMGTR